MYHGLLVKNINFGEKLLCSEHVYVTESLINFCYLQSRPALDVTSMF